MVFWNIDVKLVLLICMNWWISRRSVVVNVVELISVVVSGKMGNDCSCVFVRLFVNSVGSSM